MAQGPTYRVKFRRRREGKTNYYRRRRLLLSRRPRLVVRKTNTQIIVQVIKAKVEGDETVASAISSELATHGWVAGKNNIPAAYLTGLLAGSRAKARGIKNAVLDIGLHPPIPGSRIYSTLKGVLDAGIEVPHGPEVLPEEERITGNHIMKSYEYVESKKDEKIMFSELGKKKTTLTGIPKKFATVKKAIEAIPATELKKKSTKTKPKATPKKEKKPKKDKPKQKPPRAKPGKPKPKKLIARGKGKKKKK